MSAELAPATRAQLVTDSRTAVVTMCMVGMGFCVAESGPNHPPVLRLWTLVFLALKCLEVLLLNLCPQTCARWRLLLAPAFT